MNASYSRKAHRWTCKTCNTTFDRKTEREPIECPRCGNKVGFDYLGNFRIEYPPTGGMKYVLVEGGS